MLSQEELRIVWLQSPEGKLCGREQAKAWALREVWRAESNHTALGGRDLLLAGGVF